MSQDAHSVFLAVYSTSLSSEELTERVGIQPDRSWNRGDRLTARRTHTRSCVQYDSGLPREARADEQISALLARLAPAAPRIAAIAGDPTCEAQIRVGYFINGPQWQGRGDQRVLRGLGVFLNSAQIELLHEMGAGFEVDIFVGDIADEFADDDDEDEAA